MRPPLQVVGHWSLVLGHFLLLLASAPLSAAPTKILKPLNPGEQARIEAALPSSAPATPARPRRLLVFHRTEGFVHDSIPHGNQALLRLGAATDAYTAELSADMAAFEPANLARFDAVVFNNTTQLKFENPAHRAALLAFLARGGGMAGIHAGSDNFPTWPEAQALIGGVFHGHPWNAGDTVAVKIDEPSQPLVAPFRGQGFWIRDEIYQIGGPYSRATHRVVLSLDMSKPENARPADQIKRKDNDFPISWIKQEPTGARIFYSSLGHNSDVYYQPEILAHFLAGLQYTLGDLPLDAVPSARLSPTPEPALAPAEPLPLQSRVKPEAARAAATQLRTYDHGRDRAACVTLETYLRQHGAALAAATLREPLLALLLDSAPSPAARAVAARLLVGLLLDAELPRLAPLLAEPGAAPAALALLLEHPTPAADPVLLAALVQTAETPTRVAIVDTLGRRAARSAIPTLSRLARDTKADPALSAAAARALAVIGTPKALSTLRRARSAEPAATLALAAASTSTSNVNSSAPAHHRLAQARALLAAKPRAAEAPLLNLLADPATALPAAALAATHPDPAFISKAWATLATATPESRAAFLAALPSPLSTASRQLLATSAASDDETLAAAALAALGRHGTAAEIPLISPRLAASATVADAARAALAALHDPAADPALLDLLRDPALAAPARAALLEALANRRHLPALPLALELSKAEEPALRSAALAAAGTLARPADLPALLDLLLSAEKPADRRALQRALAATFAASPDAPAAAALAVERLPRSSAATRPALIAILASMDAPAALAAVETELADPDSTRRRDALRALASARNPSTRSLLRAAATTRLEVPAERILAQGALLDLLREADSISANAKVSDYDALWPHLQREEERQAVLAALRKMPWSDEARAVLARIAPEPAK
jgi:type 1 glutamine amidotransferase